MPIKHRKDKTRLIGRVRLRKPGQRHYLFAYLWQDRDAMLAATDIDDPRTMACHCCNSYVEHFPPRKLHDVIGAEPRSRSCPPLLGELHFVRNEWNEEIVAHELCHALVHRLRTLPNRGAVFEDMDHEEPLCLTFGQWFNQLYNWLWDFNPPKPD